MFSVCLGNSMQLSLSTAFFSQNHQHTHCAVYTTHSLCCVHYTPKNLFLKVNTLLLLNKEYKSLNLLLKIAGSWDVKPCGLVNSYRCFEGRTIYTDMAKHPRRLQSSSSSPVWDPQILRLVLLHKFLCYLSALLLSGPNYLPNFIKIQKFVIHLQSSFYISNDSYRCKHVKDIILHSVEKGKAPRCNIGLRFSHAVKTLHKSRSVHVQ
jgi:hypothetical protein